MLKPTWHSNKFIYTLIWVVGIAIRLYGSTRPSQHYDMATFEAWSRSFWVHGPTAFFGSVWSDYLPLPILSFAPISLLADLIHQPFSITFKIVHLLIELILIWFISRSTASSLKPLIYLLLLSPALIGDTSFWGQVDTIPALLALLSMQLITPSVKGIRTQGLIPSVLFGLAVAYKPIMVVIAPVLWIVDIKQGHWLRLPLISASVLFATAIPFVSNPSQVFMNLFTRALNQSGTYPFLTINAYNFWSLVPEMSWIRDSTSVLGVSGSSLGLLIFISTTLIVMNHWRKGNFSPSFAPRVAATILILFYTFNTRMHERHLLFGLPFLALSTIYQSFLIIPYLLLTITYSLNLWGAFYWVTHNQVWPWDLSAISIISWVTTLSSLFLVAIWDWSSLWPKMQSFLRKNIYLLGILVLSFALRFTNLSYPQIYIFDEVYHAFTAREYLHNRIEAWEWWTTPPKDVAYEWTHPPVAKYGMVVGMLLFGENSFGWRVGSSIFGVLSILGIYFLILKLVNRRDIALLSAFLLSIEGTHIAQSRIGMNDIYMFGFYVWALYLAVKSRWKSAALLYGLALASKWSSLYGVIPLAFIYLKENHLKSWNLKHTIYHLVTAVRLLLISLAVYVLTFAPFILAGHTWAQWWELHRQMWYYHTHLVATHGYQSTPLEWLFDVRPVWYYVKYLSEKISNIYVIGNPLILWLGLVSLASQLKKIRYYPYSLFLVLYLIFTVPWFFSPRIMFYYHYLPSSAFLCIILANLLSDLSLRIRIGLLVCFSLSLLLISPMLYGFPMPHIYWDTLFKIMPTWK